MRSPIFAFFALALTAAGLPACVYTTAPEPDPFGDIAFDWSFAGTTSCTEAQVDEVDVAVFRNGELVLEIPEEPCQGGGLIITDIIEGVYEVFIDAYDRNGQLLYAGSFSIRVVGGELNDAGLVELELAGAVAPLPEPAPGTLAFFWSFLYPTDGVTVIDCALAGVDEVDVFVAPLGSTQPVFSATASCGDEGLSIEPLPEGRYNLQLLAFGQHRGEDVLLYDSGIIIVDVGADKTVDLGDVSLERVQESFSDFDIAWGFVGESCTTAGVDVVTLAFTRDGFTDPEDVFQVDCTAASVIRQTFVPGDYIVTATAEGANFTFSAAVDVELPPGSVAEVNLLLE